MPWRGVTISKPNARGVGNFNLSHSLMAKSDNKPCGGAQGNEELSAQLQERPLIYTTFRIQVQTKRSPQPGIAQVVLLGADLASLTLSVPRSRMTWQNHLNTPLMIRQFRLLILSSPLNWARAKIQGLRT